jgi:hypothetical protein
MREEEELPFPQPTLQDEPSHKPNLEVGIVVPMTEDLLDVSNVEDWSEQRVAQSSIGVRTPGAGDIWWAQSLGVEDTNLGQVLICRVLPAKLDLGVRIIAQGNGIGLLTISVFSDDDLTEQLVDYRSNLAFDYHPGTPALGVASVKLALPRFEVSRAGLHWLTASINGGPRTELPLVIQ